MDFTSLGSGLIDFGFNQLTSAIDAGRARRFWREQNRYNHPAEGMKRLDEAGLNPNLVFGGKSGSATGQAGAIDVPNTPGISSYQDYRIKQGQIKGIEYDNRIKKAQAEKLEELNKFGFKENAGTVEQIPQFNNDGITYEDVFDTGISNYQLAARQELRLKKERAFAARVRNILESNYSPAYKRQLLDKVAADIGYVSERTGSVKDSRSAFKGLTNIVESFGGDTPVIRAILEAVRLMMLKR